VKAPERKVCELDSFISTQDSAVAVDSPAAAHQNFLHHTFPIACMCLVAAALAELDLEDDTLDTVDYVEVGLLN
jgi:hypothetical protein